MSNDPDQDLHNAILEHTRAWQLVPELDKMLLNDYVIVSHWQKIEADGTSSYSLHFSNQERPYYVCMGLLQTGVDLLRLDL